MEPHASVLKVSCNFFGMVVKVWFQPIDTFTMANDDGETNQAGYRSHRMPVMCAFMAMHALQLEDEFKGRGPKQRNRFSLKQTAEYKAFAITLKDLETQADTEGEAGKRIVNEVNSTHNLYFTTVTEQLEKLNMQWFTTGVFTILGDAFSDSDPQQLNKKIASDFKTNWLVSKSQVLTKHSRYS